LNQLPKTKDGSNPVFFSWNQSFVSSREWNSI
jgi:hypothetical protein